MPSAPDRNLQVIVARIFQGDSDVVRLFHESNDSSRPLGVCRPPGYRFFIAWVSGSYNIALEGLPQASNVGHSGQREDGGGVEEWERTTLYIFT